MSRVLSWTATTLDGFLAASTCAWSSTAATATYDVVGPL